MCLVWLHLVFNNYLNTLYTSVLSEDHWSSSSLTVSWTLHKHYFARQARRINNTADLELLTNDGDFGIKILFYNIDLSCQWLET